MMCGCFVCWGKGGGERGGVIPVFEIPSSWPLSVVVLVGAGGVTFWGFVACRWRPCRPSNAEVLCGGVSWTGVTSGEVMRLIHALVVRSVRSEIMKAVHKPVWNHASNQVYSKYKRGSENWRARISSKYSLILNLWRPVYVILIA